MAAFSAAPEVYLFFLFPFLVSGPAPKILSSKLDHYQLQIQPPHPQAGPAITSLPK